MPKTNVELRGRVEKWMKEEARTCRNPDILSNLAMANFRINYEPSWLSKMAVQTIRDLNPKG